MENYEIVYLSSLLNEKAGFFIQEELKKYDTDYMGEDASEEKESETESVNMQAESPDFSETAKDVQDTAAREEEPDKKEGDQQ